MAGSGEIRLKYGRSRRDQDEIWSDSVRSGRNLAQISLDKGEILPDLEGSRLDFVENGRKVVITR